MWWFIALSQQNDMMFDYKIGKLNKYQSDYQYQLYKINDEKRRNTAQYIGEGITFLLVIVVGAVVVFRAVRRQFKQSRQQQHFMMAITHELKTPIAIAKLNLETLQKHILPAEQQQQLLSNTLQETERLNSLCNNLLLASKIEAGDYTLTTEQIDLAELITQSANDYTLRFPKRHIVIKQEKDIILTGDRLLLQMAINNLIDNAVKYSANDTKVEIGLLKENGEIIVVVKDEGKGIPVEEKEKIFNKFYRAGHVHTKEAKGTGLGLYVTKKIVEQHDGRIGVRDNKPCGSIFEIRLQYG